MGLFIDRDGLPLAFDIFPGNKNEQPTLKPLEQKIIKDYGLGSVIVCTDAGLSSAANRKFNNKTLKGELVRGFITTQSIKSLPEYLKDFCLDRDGWHLMGDNHTYSLDNLDFEADYDKVFFKERWIVEDVSQKKRHQGVKPLEQRLIVSFSLKYMNYQHKIRQGQVERAIDLINSGKYKQRPKNQNDPHRFIGKQSITNDGEMCEKEIPFLNEELIVKESKYDGFYAVCTNLDDVTVSDIIRTNKKRWEIEECFRIMKTEFKARPMYVYREDRIKAHFITCFISLLIYRILEKKTGNKYTCEELIRTLKSMEMYRPRDKMGYIPAYMRTDLTDALHEAFGFRTDYEILSDINMKKIVRKTRKNSNK